jgi:hypothetical protein
MELCDDYNLKRSRRDKKPVVLFQWPLEYDEILKRKNEESLDIRVRKLQRTKVDHEWECYYGDGLDEMDFMRYRSQKRKLSEVNASLTERQPEGMLELQDLIQRSWDMAVHIASNVFVTEVPTVAIAREESSKQQKEKEDEPLSRQKYQVKEGWTDRMVQARAVLRCKELDIEFDPIYVPDCESYYTCQVCKKRMRYHSNEKVIVHLFGSVTEPGCCWNRIREEEENITQKILQHEALNIIDNLLHIIFQKQKLQQTNDKTKEEGPTRTPMNWFDVCNCMMETLEKAKIVGQQESMENRKVMQMLHPQDSSKYYYAYEHSNDNHGYDIPGGFKVPSENCELQTIQIDENLPPFVLNKDVMKVVLSRLILRYDDRPNKY